MQRTRAPFDLIALSSLFATTWAAQDGPVTARTTFLVSATTVLAVSQLHRWITRWSSRQGKGSPSWAGWAWRASLFGVAASAAATSWWVSTTLSPSSPHADGLLLAAGACAAVAVWPLAPWTAMPARPAVSSRTRNRPDRREDRTGMELLDERPGHRQTWGDNRTAPSSLAHTSNATSRSRRSSDSDLPRISSARCSR